MEKIGFFVLLTLICGFDSWPIEVIGDSDGDDSTTQNPNEYSNQIHFFRFPSNSFTIENNEIVKVLKLDSTFTTEEPPKLENETTPLDLLIDQNFTLEITTAEPMPQMLIVGDVAKREIDAKEFNRQRIEQENVNLPEPIDNLENWNNWMETTERNNLN